jgi:putative ABC transport system permease protein
VLRQLGYHLKLVARSVRRDPRYSLVMIVSLALTVSLRTRQIGVRRALGATRGDIVRYFLVENALATTAGIAIGLAITLPLNALMSSMVPALAWWQMALSTVLVWAAGLLSALAPALRAARTPPTVATRAL